MPIGCLEVVLLSLSVHLPRLRSERVRLHARAFVRSRRARTPAELARTRRIADLRCADSTRLAVKRVSGSRNMLEQLRSLLGPDLESTQAHLKSVAKPSCGKGNDNQDQGFEKCSKPFDAGK